MVNAPTGLNNFSKEVNNLDFGKLKAAPVNLEKLIDLLSKKVLKNTKFNPLNMKVNNLEKKNSWCVYFNSDKSIQYR